MSSTLADYVWGDKKNDFTGFYGQPSAGAYSVIRDRTGKANIPTLADVTSAEKPEDKLKLLQQMADVINIQADAGIATGRADSVASMTKSAKEMLTALDTVVSSLKSADDDEPARNKYKDQIGAALTSLRTTMDKISTLSGRASGTVASQVAGELARMDDQASALASDTGTTWRRSGSTFRADPTKLVDILV